MELSLGTVLLAPSITLGYLPQAFEPKGNLTITALLEDATKEIQEMHVTINRLMDLMTKLSDDSHALERVLSEYGDLQARFEHRGGYDLPHRVDAVLQGLGLASIDRERPVSSLSGGEQVRLGLAAVLIQSPDLLLLDEPTNHLDRKALEWLEQYLAAFSGAVMVVSHDRLFLNIVVNQIIEIDEYSHRAKRYSGNYDMYQRQKALERVQWEERYTMQQAQIQELKQRIQSAHQHVGHNRPPKDNNKMAYKGHHAKVERAVGRNIQSAEVELVRIQANAVPRPQNLFALMRTSNGWLRIMRLPLLVQRFRTYCRTVDTFSKESVSPLGVPRGCSSWDPMGQGRRHCSMLSRAFGHRRPEWYFDQRERGLGMYHRTCIGRTQFEPYWKSLGESLLRRVSDDLQSNATIKLLRL